jgi:hypothetical protein
MTQKFYFVLLAALLLTGCRSTESKQAKQIVWHQAGKTQQEIAKDFFDCKLEASQLSNKYSLVGGASGIANYADYWSAIANCMESKGYTRCPRDQVPKGEATIR